MATWSRGQRVCASCRYWGGKREIDYTATFYNAKDDGLCHGPFGSFRGSHTNEGASCGFWEVFREN